MKYLRALAVALLATTALLTAVPALGANSASPPITFKLKLGPTAAISGGCDQGVCYLLLYDGPADTLYIGCTPAQFALLTNGRTHDVVIGMFGTVIETTPITELYVVAVTS